MALNIPPQHDKKNANPQINKDKQGLLHVRDAHTGKFLDVKMQNGEKFPKSLRNKAMNVINKLKDK